MFSGGDKDDNNPQDWEILNSEVRGFLNGRGLPLAEGVTVDGVLMVLVWLFSDLHFSHFLRVYRHSRHSRHSPISRKKWYNGQSGQKGRTKNMNQK